MELHEELGDVVRKWRALTKREIHDWELKAIDLKNAVQEGDQRFSDLQDEHKDVLDHNRKLEAVAQAAKTLKYEDRNWERGYSDTWLTLLNALAELENA